MKKSTILFIFAVLAYGSSLAQLEGNSVQLKADGNFISITDASSVSLNDTMTIEMMLYFRCNNGQSTHLITKGWCGSTWSFYFSIFANKLRLGRWHTGLAGCAAGAQALFESTDSIEVNTWTHVAVRIVDLNVEFFIDGVNAGSTLLSGTNGDGFHTSNQPLRIGNYVNLGGSNTGTPKANIDEVRLWHTARTDAELLANMNQELVGNEPGLKAYFKLNETGSGAGISVLNSAVGSPLPNGTTTGTAANIFFTNNTTIQNSLPTCDPVLWLKADAGAYTNAGVTLALDGQSIQQWNDQSANAYHCAQADASKRPIWQANAFYGKPALWFDGVNGNYWLENATQTPVATAGMPRTYFVVAKAACEATGYAGGHLFTNRRSPNASTLEFVKNGASIFHGGNFCCNHPEVTNVNFDEGRLQPFVGTWRTAGTNTNLDFWFNGISKITANANFVADNGNPGYCVGDRRDAFQFDSPNGAYDWQGHIAEIIVYNYALSNKQRLLVENYLKNKYKAALPAIFTGTPNTSTYSTNILNDAVWDHSYNSVNNTEVIASVKDNCLDLGTRNDTVYAEPTAGLYNGQRYMRRHYVINTSLNPVGTKRVRLYYTNADFADLQSYEPSLNNHNQLVVTKYDGPNEDGIFNPAGGSITFIPSAQITTGTAFGQRYLECNVDGFSEFWIHTGNAPLPLDIISFSGTLQNNMAQLQWETANMVNVKGFDVEKSIDASTFASIGFVAATAANTYRLTDPHCYDRNNYYRLKIIDIDDQFTYSNTITVLNTSKVDISIFPNPVRNELKMVSSTPNFTYTILDIYGHEVMSGYSNSTSVEVPTISLSKGMYVVQIETTTEHKTIKFVKE
ncbi:MAG: T9SS type A sorting domain-containing protein [Bacteroidetes bacterium]|nr:T9SS type A sorting domain-containing protein [Bacteroidota bacterium]